MEARMKDTYARGDLWRRSSGPVAAPNAVNLFDNQRYLGGVLVLSALCELVGEDVFRRIERTFLECHRGSSASTEDYIAIASEVSGQDRSAPVPPGLLAPRNREPGHYPDSTATL
jgi:hypothetical protein